ncbi:MAG: hypothetical protein WA946_01360 [Nitrospirota bacterium]
MKKFFVSILALVMIAAVAFFGCEKKQAATPPPAQPVVTPAAPAPVPAPTPVPVPAPAPSKPAKK